jgi:hypothetical protein
MLPLESIVPLCLFAGMTLLLALYALTASGHFPRAVDDGGGINPAILWGSFVIALVSLAIALIAAWRLVPWHAAVIGGGLAILLAPLILQMFTNRFVDGNASLVVFSGTVAAVSLILAVLLRNPS